MRIAAGRRGAVITLAVLLLDRSRIASFAGGPGQTASVSSVVRCSDARLCALLDAGRARSPTLNALINRLAGLNGMIYVAWTPTLTPPLEAALLHRVQVTPDGARCLWIVFHRRSHLSPALLPVMAHELQHAIEVLESGATTAADVDGLFKRLPPASSRAHDTAEAARVQQLVAQELR